MQIDVLMHVIFTATAIQVQLFSGLQYKAKSLGSPPTAFFFFPTIWIYVFSNLIKMATFFLTVLFQCSWPLQYTALHTSLFAEVTLLTPG